MTSDSIANQALRFIIRWVTTTNHKDIGILYILTSIYFFLVAGILGMLVRAQLTSPSGSILVGKEYNEAVTMHGLFMLLWFASPLAFGIANYVVPLQIGARDLAFPRLNALSYWIYLASGLIALASFFSPGGTADVGWTLYAPLTSSLYSPYRGLDMIVLAIILFSISVTLGTINFLVTIVKMRAPGMKWIRLPMFSWTIIFTILLMLWAFPTLLAASFLLFLDRNIGTRFYESPVGGGLLWAHLFWFFGHPEVYIILFPALGLIADIISTFSRRQLFAKHIIVLGLSLGTVLSFVVWIHHMFITGIALELRKLQSFTTAIISVPFEMTVIAMILTLWRGRLWLTTPALFAIGAIFNFIIGGASGVFLSSVPLDIAFRGTYWVVGHFHYIVAGVITFGLMAGLYYYYPKITGRMYSERLGKIHFILSFLSIHLLYFPMLALMDMPRRIYQYDPSWSTLNLIASIGGFIFGVSFIIPLANFIYSLARGPKAPDNPWGAYTLEWLTKSPPPRYNFEGEPFIDSNGRVIFIATNGGHHGYHYLDHYTITPFGLGLGALLFGLGLSFSPTLITLFKLDVTVLSLLGLAVMIVSLVKWVWDDINDRFSIPDLKGEDWPFTGVDKVRSGVWVFLMGEMFLFGSLIGAWIFIRTRSLTWEPGYISHDIVIGLLNTFILFTATYFYLLGYLSIRRGNTASFILNLTFALALMLAFLLVKVFEWNHLVESGYTPALGLQAQLYYALTGLHGIHVLLGALAIVYLLVKALNGKYTKVSHNGIIEVGLYIGMVELIWVFLFPMFYLL
ncbi:MAG: cbb3-type cytochrome c oxidase subunit I [Acidilobaceae archaeon]